MDKLLSMQLRKLRIESRLTQDELANLSGVSRKTISAIEDKEGGEGASISTLSRVLRALGSEFKIVPLVKPTLDDLLAENSRIFLRQKETKPPIFVARVRKTNKEKEAAYAS
jgi:transcriptional regulator with XRE-family HTH domain